MCSTTWLRGLSRLSLSSQVVGFSKVLDRSSATQDPIELFVNRRLQLVAVQLTVGSLPHPNCLADGDMAPTVAT
jgi:hypothetical protein